MAKGFTVKAKKPKPSESTQEWDYDKAREMVKGKTIVFCLPGRGVSYTYLKNFVQLCFDLGTGRSKHSNLARLFINGEFCKMQVSGCECTARTGSDSLGRKVAV